MIPKKKSITMKSDPEFRRMLKKLSADLDSTMIKTQKSLIEYEEEIKELLGRKRR